ncbi:MAG: polysaccharide deacetylase family protein [Actinomycetota bacterium]|nr:polysaccharide deacetylase family protein [Actinomycetota bacterium]
MGGSLVVFGYHRVGPRFGKHVDQIRSHCEIVPLWEGLEAVERGEGRRLAAITFDDAYRDVHRHALPVLRERRVAATVFVPTAAIGQTRFWWDRLDAIVTAGATRGHNGDIRSTGGTWLRSAEQVRALRSHVRHADGGTRDRLLAKWEAEFECRAEEDEDARLIMDWAELCEVSKAGVEVASHSVSHENLAALGDAELDRELQESRERLEAAVAAKVNGFAYPFGRAPYVDRRVRDRTRAAGYEYAVTTLPGVNRRPVDPFMVHRYLVGPAERDWVMKAMANGAWSYLRRAQSGKRAARSVLSRMRQGALREG